jgi:hypothetical protein
VCLGSVLAELRIVLRCPSRALQSLLQRRHQQAPAPGWALALQTVPVVVLLCLGSAVRLMALRRAVAASALMSVRRGTRPLPCL